MTDSEPLDLGPIEPGEAPGNRHVPEGQHPWSLTQITQFQDSNTIGHLMRFLNAVDVRESGTVSLDELDPAGVESYRADATRIVKAMRILGWGPTGAGARERLVTREEFDRVAHAISWAAEPKDPMIDWPTEDDAPAVLAAALEGLGMVAEELS